MASSLEQQDRVWDAYARDKIESLWRTEGNSEKEEGGWVGEGEIKEKEELKRPRFNTLHVLYKVNW